MIGPDDVRAAARVLEGVAHRTPVIRSHALGDNVVAQAREPAARRRVQVPRRVQQDLVASEGRRASSPYSSGNHAQAVALASRLLGAHATILMPEDAPPSKVAATRGYGAEIVIYDRYTGDREAIAAELARERERARSCRRTTTR